MALLMILAMIGAIYTLFTNSPYPVRRFELTAVWGTLGLIALALSSNIEPLISLSVAAALTAPLWYLTLSISRQHARSEAFETASLWRDWQATVGAHAGGSTIGDENRPALAALLDPDELRNNTQSVPAPNLQLAPTEYIPARRGRV